MRQAILPDWWLIYLCQSFIILAQQKRIQYLSWRLGNSQESSGVPAALVKTGPVGDDWKQAWFLEPSCAGHTDRCRWEESGWGSGASKSACWRSGGGGTQGPASHGAVETMKVGLKLREHAQKEGFHVFCKGFFFPVCKGEERKGLDDG